jgi:hypothetical protein
MKKHLFVMLSVLSLAAPACVIRDTSRDVGSVASDGTVYLGWNLIGSDGGPSKPNDEDTYDLGANLGSFSAIRLHAEKPISIVQVLVVFANGERVAVQAPAAMNTDEWSAPIPLPGGPRQIYSIVVTGRATTSLLSKLEIHGTR